MEDSISQKSLKSEPYVYNFNKTNLKDVFKWPSDQELMHESESNIILFVDEDDYIYELIRRHDLTLNSLENASQITSLNKLLGGMKCIQDFQIFNVQSTNTSSVNLSDLDISKNSGICTTSVIKQTLLNEVSFLN